MKRFNHPQTLEELKKQYKQLAVKHHPDKGGNTADMQEINAEYDRLFELLKNTHRCKGNEETFYRRSMYHRQSCCKCFLCSGLAFETHQNHCCKWGKVI